MYLYIGTTHNDYYQTTHNDYYQTSTSAQEWKGEWGWMQVLSIDRTVGWQVKGQDWTVEAWFQNCPVEKKEEKKRKAYWVSKHTFVSLHPLFNWTIVFFVPYTFFLNLPKELCVWEGRGGKLNPCPGSHTPDHEYKGNNKITELRTIL